MRIVLALFIVAGSSCAFADNWSKQWTVSGSPELRVDAGDGRVEVTRGSTDRIKAEVTTTGWRIGPGQVTVEERQNGNRVEIEIHVPKRHFEAGWPGSRSIQVRVQVPENTASSLHTGDGAIRIEGIHGRMDLRTGDGSIEALEMDGALEAHTGDGHVHISGRLDELHIDTGDGGVDAEIGAGSHLGSDWHVQTGDGHVTLRLPDGLHAELSAHTGDGSITVSLPGTTEAGGSNHHDLRAKLNGGGPSFTITTGDGPIRIDRT